MFKKLAAFLYFALFLTANLMPLGLGRAGADAANLIANPSVETASATDSSQPQDWQQGGWGTNTSALTYENTGYDGGHSLKVQISSYTSGDAKWYFTPVAVTAGQQYTFSDYYQSSVASDIVAQYDDGAGNYNYVDFGTQPASSSWKQASLNLTVPAGEKNLTIFHLINSAGWLQTDEYSLASYTAPSAPTVSLTAPAPGATVSGSVQLSAGASDNSGVAGVQFKIDGNNIGNEVTSAPYQLNWDTTAVTNGSHSLTAVARNVNNVTTTSQPVQVTVNNPVAPGTNLIANSSFETPSSADSTQPAGWSQGGWGTNTAAFTYQNTGHTGSRSAKVQITSYTSGDAKWYFAPVPVTAGFQYTFSDYYQSDVASDLTAQFDDGAGHYSYLDMGAQAASAGWKQATASFTVPAGMKNLTIFHLINSVGQLQTDDYSLTAQTATPPPPPVSGTANFTTNSDTYVTATYPAKNFGTKANLYADGSPVSESLIGFNVSGLNGAQITNAVLKVYAQSANNQGLSAAAYTGPAWTETGLTYNNFNKAGVGPALASAKPVAKNSWVSFDVTKAVNGEGSYSFALVPTNSTNTKFASREAGSAYAPQLVLTTASGTTPPAGGGGGSTGNMVPNPSLETSDPANPDKPQAWSNGKWGTNSTAFSYLTSGRTGARSIKTQISSYSSGSAYWYSNQIPVTAGQMYNFSDYYQSSVISEIDAGYTMNDGTEHDVYLGEAFESPNSWTKFTAQFTVPAGAVSVTFYHSIYSVGWLQTDDYSLNSFAYQGFNRPIVSLTFDDGYESFYQYGLPLLQKYGFSSTDYIITGVLGVDPSYMTSDQVKQLHAAGQDVESHTVSHPDLTTLSAAAMDQELKNSQSTLQSLLGVPVKGLATPYGSSNNQVLTDAANYYSYVRGVQAGYNAKNNFDPYNIQVQNIEVTTPVSQVEQWIQQAKATNTWLVLVYHQVDPTLTNETAQPYNTYPSDLDSELAYIKSTGVAVETMAQAISEITPQL